MDVKEANHESSGSLLVLITAIVDNKIACFNFPFEFQTPGGR